MKKSRLLGAARLLLITALIPLSAKAALVDYNFSGNVTTNDSGGLFGGKNIGDPFAGSFTIDTSASTLTTGGDEATYDTGNFKVAVDGTSYTVDLVRVRDGTGGVSRPAQMEIGFNVTDTQSGFITLRTSSMLFAGPSIPSMFDISDFNFARLENHAFEPFAFDEGDITALSSVPIPPALWLFGSGLLGLVGIATRKKAA